MTDAEEIELVTADETTQEFDIGEAPQGASTLLAAMRLLWAHCVNSLCNSDELCGGSSNVECDLFAAAADEEEDMEDVGDDEEDDKITADDADVRDDAQQVRKALLL